MRLALFSIKRCWLSTGSPSGIATDGGFPQQVSALSELFDSTVLVVPCLSANPGGAETPVVGHNLSIVKLSYPVGRGIWRKLSFPFWLVRNWRVLLGAVRAADAVHAPIPGDIGTIGMLLAFLFRKPLFVRHCGNWFGPKTTAEHSWKCFMERVAGGRNVMLATGGGDVLPSRNSAVRWIFSSSLTGQELRQYAAEKTFPANGHARLIIVARQSRAKGAGVVIKALSLIRDRFPSLVFDVVGEGPALSEFRQQADRLALKDRVLFHGGQSHSDVMRLLQQAHLFCFPTSASDGFPKAVLEALASGLPVIATPVSVLPSLLKGGCGRLVDQPTPEAVAAAVCECLRDPVQYRGMSAAALQVASEYSLERWRDTIGELLTAAWGPLRKNAGSR